MSDLLVKLYDLEDDCSSIGKLKKAGFTIRKPIGPEKYRLLNWVKRNFNPNWQAEADVAFSNFPRTCFVAVKNKKIIGFSCYDATAPGFFGPIGVGKQFRGKGIGNALLLAALLDMKSKGYGYAIVGMTSKIGFYRKAVGAEPIKGSSKSIFG